MSAPRDSDPVEPTLVPGSPAAAPSAADTPAHPAPHDETIAPQPAKLPGPVAGATIVEATLAPASGVAEAEAEATRMPGLASSTNAGASPVTIRDKTTGPNKTVANGASSAATPGSASAPPATGTMVGRFALKGLHAKGGLGEVFTARDTELNREVAVKRIQTRYADDPGSRSRFLTEAEITARLDHPGVVPVFGLVSDGFGRPCYAMRFIRGETLKDEIERYHRRESGGRSPESGKTEASDPKPGTAPVAAPPAPVEAQPQSVAFRHLLQRFIAVCQAIGYAHTRNVIHRDIKPANVMVGAFGETLVVDWGLAKALDDGPDAAKILKTIAESGFKHDPDATEYPSHMTLAGTAVGTPAYMAPEQASGKLELVGPRADVYSLGATLFAILTGQAPFSGSTADTLERVRRGDVPTARSLNSNAPAPLESVCRKAMALSPDARYPTALDLATDVERWLSDEPVSCHRYSLTARMARWARRHPARIAAGVSLLLAGVLAIAGVAWAVNEGRRNTQAALNLVTDEQKKTAAERDRATEAEKATAIERDIVKEEKKKTEQARDVARERYELAVKAFNTLVTDIQKQLADRAGTQEFRATLLKQAQKGLTELVKGAGAERVGADRTLVAAHRQMGDVYQILGNTREARKEFDESVRMAEEVLKLTPDSWEAKRDLGRSLLGLTGIHLHAGDTAAARKACEQARDLFRAVRKAQPDDREAAADLTTAEGKLADIFMERGETGPASEQCHAALKTRRVLAEANPDDLLAKRHLADSLDQCSRILLHAGRVDDARKAAEECVSVREKVHEKLDDQPDVRRELAAAHARFGEIHLDRGDLAAARKEYDAARAVLNKLVTDDPRNSAARAAFAASHRRLSLIALRTGDLDAALKSATEARTLSLELETADPTSARARRDLAESQEQIGDVLLARGKPREALDAFSASVALLAPIHKSDPDSTLSEYELARSLEQVGEAHRALGNPAEAVKALTESVSLRSHVLSADRECARAKRDLATGFGELADSQRASGDPVGAREVSGRAVALLREIVNKDANNMPARHDLAAATGKWGELLQETGKSTTALIAVSQSLDQFKALAGSDQDNAKAKANVAGAWERLAGLYADLGEAEPAMAAARTALGLRRELAKQAGETKTAKRELAESLTRAAGTYAALRHFDLARKGYADARELVAPDQSDPATTAAARQAEAQLALLNAIEAVVKDPETGPERVPAELRVPAIRTAMEWLRKGGQTVTAATLARQLATLSKTPDDLYAAAHTLVRCSTANNITDPAPERYRTAAVAALEEAVRAGFRKPEALTGTDWNPCREMPAFQRVVQSLEAGKK